MNVIIGGASTIRDSKQMRGHYGTEHGQQFKGGMAMKGCPFVVAKGAPRTFTYYALKRNREPDEFMEECARHAVAMRLYCFGANDPRWEQSKHLGGIYPNMGRLGAGTGFTGTAGYACEWHLDSSTRGTFETTFRAASSTS